MAVSAVSLSVGVQSSPPRAAQQPASSHPTSTPIPKQTSNAGQTQSAHGHHHGGGHHGGHGGGASAASTTSGATSAPGGLVNVTA